MKRLSLITAISAALVLPGLVQAADNDSATLALDATVTGTCYIDGNFANLSFDGKVAPATAKLDATGIAVTGLAAYCNNTGTKLEMKSLNGGLLDSTVAAIAGGGSFAGVTDGANGRILLYTTSDGTWSGVGLADFDSNGQTKDTFPETPLLSTTAINGDIVFTVTLDDQGGVNPVLAGDYTDTITVKISTTP